MVATCAALLAVVSTATACRAEPEVSGPRVLVIGNSIMADSAPEVTEVLEADGWQVTIDAVPGTSIEQWPRPAALLRAEVRPDVAIVELGTNDNGRSPSLGYDIDRVMQALLGTELVLWLNVREQAALPPAPRAINLAIASAVARWPNLRVIDFDGFFAGHPEWLQPDGIHPNSSGQAALAALIRRTLATVRRSAGP